MQLHAHEFVLPAGSMALVIDLDVERADNALICGARSRPLVLSTSRPLRLIAAHFKTGAGFPFAGCPAGELSNAQVPLSLFWPNEAAELCERIGEAQTDQQRFLVFETFLAGRVHASRPPNPAVLYAVRRFQHPPPAHSVREVAAEVGMSAHRFIDTFRNDVGLTPKVFARLARFRRTVDHIDMVPPIDWIDAALANGYFDQPHFIRDFREFSGVSPSAFLRLRTSKNHVRVPD
jgi:AraC-like DNA-binding protein